MPEPIGSIFRKIVKVLQVHNKNPFNSLSDPLSPINDRLSEINSPTSDYNEPSSQYNYWFASKKLRRDALYELMRKYLSEYLTIWQMEEIVAIRVR